MRIGRLIATIFLLLILLALLGLLPSTFPPPLQGFVEAVVGFFSLFIWIIIGILIVSYIANFIKSRRSRKRITTSTISRGERTPLRGTLPRNKPETEVPSRVDILQSRAEVPKPTLRRLETSLPPLPSAEKGSVKRGNTVLNTDLLNRLLKESIQYYIPASARGPPVRLRRGIPGLRTELEGAVCYPVGEGAWSRVYFCTSINGERYSLKIPKVLKLESIIDEEQSITIDDVIIKRFVNEIENIKRLSHPCIIKLIDYSITTPAILYEFADGLSLSYQFSKGWKPTLRDIMLILIQITDAIRYIHSRGIVHGDLKLGNILISNGIAKICDFNTVRNLLSSTTFNIVLPCTKGYCAPEQLMSDLKRRSAELGLEYKIDIYQLGNIILALFTRDTIDGEDRLKISDIEINRKLLSLPEELRGLVYRMLEIDPLKRPTAEEVLRELVDFYERTFSRI